MSFTHKSVDSFINIVVVIAVINDRQQHAYTTAAQSLGCCYFAQMKPDQGMPTSLQFLLLQIAVETVVLLL